MEIALGLPQIGAHATREHVIEVAQAAEEGGYDALSVADHVVMPREYVSRHPDRPGGVLPARYQPDRDLLEPLTLLAFAASVTSRIRLGTAVLVLPMRQPVLHAKILASLDRLAGPGRVYLAAGVGWAREEFEVLSAPWPAPRRARRGAGRADARALERRAGGPPRRVLRGRRLDLAACPGDADPWSGWAARARPRSAAPGASPTAGSRASTACPPSARTPPPSAAPPRRPDATRTGSPSASAASPASPPATRRRPRAPPSMRPRSACSTGASEWRPAPARPPI